ncbi:MAG: hypothetical protein HN778_05710 [Prolixibacteraceae bacterium]|jgi:hypothetical protein|nr:hypothetical protein [Prolixibacteraceae bacterium]MBT6764389.1 hypothetical protein [Prolixibacteraceae bacterium]MBT6999417.1 hypothetical protein [Prolixibacteraceae bacterium]MBT7394311.1 hypothetical protein [Prolixibacteraceae bacterium]
MKAIILISSIFYILGLKIGNKIDLVKKSNPVEKIITNNIIVKKPAKTICFKDEVEIKVNQDSLKGGTINDELLSK